MESCRKSATRPSPQRIAANLRSPSTTSTISSTSCARPWYKARPQAREGSRMNADNVIDVTRLIQLAVAPVFLLTAVGTIIGVLSNRLGRAVDRSRTLEDRLRQLLPEGQKAARAELNLLSRRVRLVYGSIVLSVICALFVGLLIAVAFVDAFIAIDLSRFIGLLFIAAMLAFILSLLVFLREIFLAVSSARSQMR